MELNEKTVLVTGASRGIGRHIAKQFADRGARVVVHYHRDLVAAKQTLSSLQKGAHLMLQADLANEDGVRDLVEQTVRRSGGIDVLVNNAGVYDLQGLEEGSFEDWQKSWAHTLSVNLLAPAHLCFWAARHMIEQGGGRIVNVSSRGAFRGEPHAPAYGASKAGLNALSQSLALALARHQVYVTSVAPGFVETDMSAGVLAGPGGEAVRKESPLERVARPEEVASVVVFLASEAPAYITGCIVDVNGASYLRT
jgi:NAD(P)-dependent dehydrogenase (short-subunit alcohol dehydrogenase family)